GQLCRTGKAFGRDQVMDLIDKNPVRTAYIGAHLFDHWAKPRQEGGTLREREGDQIEDHVAFAILERINSQAGIGRLVWCAESDRALEVFEVAFRIEQKSRGIPGEDR